MWRAERPQKGRFRQFKQCDIDIIGVADTSAETELILATSEALVALGFKNFKVRINDRRILSALVRYCGIEDIDQNKVFVVLDKLSKIGIDGVDEELQKEGISSDLSNCLIQTIKKVTKNTLTVENIGSTIEGIDKNILNDLDCVIKTVNKEADNKYSVVFDISLVRGMGYYTGQIFEIETEGYGVSIAGGGRYNNLIGSFLEEKTIVPACGFSIGFERVISILEEQNFQIPKTKKKTVLIYSVEETSDASDVFSAAQKLRNEGRIVLVETKSKNVKQQLDALMKQGFDSFAMFKKGEEIDIKSFS